MDRIGVREPDDGARHDSGPQLNGGDLGDHLLNAITDLRERSAPIAQRLLADRAEGANS